MSLVSIVIPYYKKKNYINKTIKSALNQSYKKTEIIIVYDDDDKEELEFLKQNYKKINKIKIIVNKKNLGAGLSRNNGIKNSKGKYIAFLDADDLWKKNKLINQIKFMKKNKALISHTSYNTLDLRGKVVGKRIARNFYHVNDLLKSCDIGLSTVIIDKKVYGRDCNFSNFKTKEDFIFWLKLLNKGYFIYGLDQNLASWKETENSLSSSIIQKLADGYKVYFSYMKFNFLKSFLYLIYLSLNFIKKDYLKWN